MCRLVCRHDLKWRWFVVVATVVVFGLGEGRGQPSHGPSDWLTAFGIQTSSFLLDSIDSAVALHPSGFGKEAFITQRVRPISMHSPDLLAWLRRP